MICRERMLAALSGEVPDHTPCSCLLFRNPWEKLSIDLRTAKRHCR